MRRGDGADASSAAAPPPRSSTRKPVVDVADYVSLKLAGPDGEVALKPDLAAKASPELLFRLARDARAAPELRLAAAERAASLNVIAGDELARAYREAAAKLPEGAKSGPALRARLFASFDNAPSANIRAESIAALLASARDQGIEVPVAQALAQAAAGLVEDPQADFFAETGVRIAALAGDEESAWAWIDTGGERMRSWQLLLAASDPQGPRAEAALAAGIDLALKGGLAAAFAASPRHRARCARLRGADSAVGRSQQDAAAGRRRFAADRRADRLEASSRCRRCRAHRADRGRGVGAERRQGRPSHRAWRCACAR